MFLEVVQRRNPKLVEFATELHQKGFISPNTYVVDLETIKNNSQAISREAKKLDIELFFMTKQFGRNPLLSKAIVEAGIEKAVAVDPWEALSLNKNGIKIGHVGHLVQIPKKMIPQILMLNPDFVTVFSYENAKNISDVSASMNKKQKIFLRVANENDFLYDGQEGGFTYKQLTEQIEQLEKLTGIEIAGLTSFPCLLIDGGIPETTPNVESMLKVKEFLEGRDYQSLEMNMPSATSTATLNLLKMCGATQGEPGHALTGTTPLHAMEDLAEKPAMVYVSEVSHFYNDKAFVFGGGFYPRSKMQGALVGSSIDSLRYYPIVENDPTNIDYYGALKTNDVKIGDTAIYAFRTQVFVTNAQVAVVGNITTNPELLGIYDSKGNVIR
ncbi:YhfX family PLP-dependent enzyme [Robertmurraya siralis]|uniref:YhfX family PLP-dependent enzyme n=1 Tax=Robertmurraya siralis TaxID=77777 RepID=UPI000BA62769|nr:YhfX family PLP-dependent enzyme [Robertmurraya siralis]PAE19308.1 amino-acid racemase [Bacillus sp. 7504-2]